jgi:uncharacterized RDD family membrane protein YckC
MSGAGFEIICNGCRGVVPSDAADCPACGVGLWGPRRGSPAPAALRAAPEPAPALNRAAPVFATAPGGLAASGYAVAAARQAMAAGAYAGFWIRAAATLVDSLLVGIVLAAVFLTVGPRPFAITAAAFGLLYNPLLESSGARGTLGKTLCGLTVADLSGRRISFGRAFVRNLAKILSGLPLNLGYVLAGVTARKQALHDLLAQTIVLKQ